ncbi:hypothetical protein THF1C08_10182 [Vibrio jasicida]|uniref:Uncharacterized protein n=1 Tax=Vibrio jasicida TaxID=766224 RepID=A0AAU9QDH8_9VIBR|nr:hypothetical protein THF1C08_10182 [Vibrio jasicida]CAH1563552.1 hypothetical protein THF1A12_10181 [Vibrio jasicida]
MFCLLFLVCNSIDYLNMHFVIHSLGSIKHASKSYNFNTGFFISYCVQRAKNFVRLLSRKNGN